MTIVRPADPVTAPARREQMRQLLRDIKARLEAEKQTAASPANQDDQSFGVEAYLSTSVSRVARR